MPKPTRALLSAFLVILAAACGSSTAEGTATSTSSDPWCRADWTGVTIAPPPGDPAPCPEPATRSERALDAVVRLMTPETFAGMWFENEDRDLLVGYVGDAPDLADLPGVTALVERDMSLVEMEQLAAERNQQEELGYVWRVNVGEGTVEREGREPIETGDHITDYESCDTAIPKWLEHGESDAEFWTWHVTPEYPDGYWLLQCIDPDTEEWMLWRLTPDGAELYDPSSGAE